MPFYENEHFTTQFVFFQARYVMIPYIWAIKFRKFLCSPIENCIPALHTSEQYTTTSIENTSCHSLENRLRIHWMSRCIGKQNCTGQSRSQIPKLSKFYLECQKQEMKFLIYSISSDTILYVYISTNGHETLGNSIHITNDTETKQFLREYLHRWFPNS